MLPFRIAYRQLFFAAFIFLMITGCNPGSNQESGHKGYELVYSQDFEDTNAVKDFVFTEAAQWKIAPDSRGNLCLQTAGYKDYKPVYRSPFVIAVLDNLEFSDFILEADLCQVKVDHDCKGDSCVFCKHRDMCVFWAFRDPSRFYYAHLAKAGDEVSHQVHIVNQAPRTAITEWRNKGVDWGDDQWKHIKVERSLEDTTVRVFFENMAHPVLVAKSNIFSSGKIGFGSFDEAGMIDNIRVWAKNRSKVQPSEYFERKAD